MLISSVSAESWILMNKVATDEHGSCLLPEVVREDTQSGPNGSRCGASRQDTAQTEFAFKHTDRSFDAAAKALQLPKPSRFLMPFLFFVQSADFRNPDPLNSSTTQCRDVLFTVIAPVCAQLRRLYVEIVLRFAHQRKQLRTITGIALMNFIVKDDPRTILNQLQGVPNFHRYSQFAFVDGAGLLFM